MEVGCPDVVFHQGIAEYPPGGFVVLDPLATSNLDKVMLRAGLMWERRPSVAIFLGDRIGIR